MTALGRRDRAGIILTFRRPHGVWSRVINTLAAVLGVILLVVLGVALAILVVLPMWAINTPVEANPTVWDVLGVGMATIMATMATGLVAFRFLRNR